MIRKLVQLSLDRSYAASNRRARKVVGGLYEYYQWVVPEIYKARCVKKVQEESDVDGPSVRSTLGPEIVETADETSFEKVFIQTFNRVFNWITGI